MSFGRPDSEQQLSYGGYLKIQELLELQHLRSSPAQHDETLFIVIHQVYELWFKQILHEIDAVMRHLDADEALGAQRTLRRCIEIQRVLVSQVSVLETMTPMDFLAFRDHLMPASGFQSAQFREIEYLSGLKEARFLENYHEESGERKRLEARLSGPTLQDGFYELLRRRGFDLPEGEDEEERGRRLEELMRLHREVERHYDLFLLGESLIEYDETFTLWRMRHVQMVERVIGGRPGTGGSDGASYLRSTVPRRFFPELWEIRGMIGARAYRDRPDPGATEQV